jgi:hypothetical protein
MYLLKATSKEREIMGKCCGSGGLWTGLLMGGVAGVSLARLLARQEMAVGGVKGKLKKMMAMGRPQAVEQPYDPRRATSIALQPGGPSAAVAAAGDKVYLGVGQQILVLDISTPAKPVGFGISEILPGRIKHIKLHGNLAYVIAQDAGMRMLDITHPAAPTWRGGYGRLHQTTDLSTRQNSSQEEYGISDVSQLGERPYLALAGHDLHLVDVSNPDTPRQVTLFPLAGSGQYVWAAGDLAYVSYAEEIQGVWFYGVYLIDTAALSLCGAIETGPPHGVAVAGSRAYIAGGDTGLHIVDVSDPIAPVTLGKYEVTATNVVVSDNLVYLTDGGSLHILDAGDPTAIKTLSTYKAKGGTWGLAVADKRAYIAAGEYGLHIIDVSDPTAPAPITTYDIGWRPQGREN